MPRAALETVEQHIASVASLHELLYRSRDEGDVDVAELVEAVVGLLRNVLPAEITLAADLAPAQIGCERAGKVAMVVNEFVTNSLKHAFPAQRIGCIAITGRVTGDRYELHCSDDGVGGVGSHSPDRRSSGRQGLGQTIMDAAAAELLGTLERHEPPQGCAVSLSFPQRVAAAERHDVQLQAA